MAQAWIFQANPDRFDIDGYLTTRPVELTWLVTRYADLISPGDQVFLWRAKGVGSAADSGVIAECIVLEPAAERLDDPATAQFWKDPSEAGVTRYRAVLRILRIAGKREIIRREWLKEDPVLRDLLILRRADSANFELNAEQAARLNALWLKTGKDWSYAESVAGLWAYNRTLGGEVSKIPGSHVAQVALLIGRAIGGVYNKVMNYRAIDPRDLRKGMSAGGATDRAVWGEFYDLVTSSIRADALEVEFERLWSNRLPSGPSDEAEAVIAGFESDAAELSRLSLADLFARYQAGAGRRPAKPPSRPSITRTYDRNPVVVAYAKVRAEFKCEVPSCMHPTFLDQGAQTYCEVHHIRPLAEGGADTIENVACLCPAHHREVHLGGEAIKIRQSLVILRAPSAT